MPLDVNGLAYVRSRIGKGVPPADVDLDAAFDRLGYREAVALEYLNAALAELLTGGRPASGSIAGEVTANWDGNIRGLENQIKRVQAELDAAMSAATGDTTTPMPELTQTRLKPRRSR
jgi:transcriptional regulator with AAA-type ATPase domain